MLIWTLALFLVVEPLLGHVIEPMVYGRSTGLSPVAVVVSAAFWTALWGPIGLVLATPLTVCLVVIGRHVERLEFLDVMFGDRPALSPPEIFYQRMLANDPTEAAEKAEEFLKERSLIAYCDEVAVKGLQLAQADADRGALAYDRLATIRDAVAELTADLSDQNDGPLAKRETTSDPEAASAVDSSASSGAIDTIPILSKDNLAEGWRSEQPVLCVAGRTPIDEAAAVILAQLSSAHGLGAKVSGAEALSTANVIKLEPAGVAIACLIYIGNSGVAHMRYSVRRLKRRLPRAKVMLVCCAADVDQEAAKVLQEATKADLVAASMGEAVRMCIEAAQAKASQLAPLEQQGTTTNVA